MSKGPYLKPCPFCGFTKPEEIFAMNEHWILCPQCKSSCGAQGSGITAITLWNNRPDEEKGVQLAPPKGQSLASLWGQWPGDESIEDLLQALKS